MNFFVREFLVLFVALAAAGILLQCLYAQAQKRTWERRWKQCLAEAAKSIARVKAEFPHCEGVMCAITLASEFTQASSAYRDLPFEDLMDLLDMMDPGQTPLFSMSDRGKELGNTQFASEVDQYNAPQGAIGFPDGYALQNGEIVDVTSNRRKIGNYGQQFRSGYGAGYIAMKVPKLPGDGKGGIMKTGATRALINFRQTIECAMASFDQTASADAGLGGNQAGSVTAGIRKMVDGNNSYQGGENGFAFGQPPDIYYAPANACVAEGTTLAAGFSYNFIQQALLALRQTTMRNKTYMYNVGLGLRQAITGLIKPQPIPGPAGAVPGQVTMFTQELKDSKLGARIDVIFTDYGTLMVKETDYIGTTTTDVTGNPTAVRANRIYINKPNYGLIVDTEKVKLRFGIAPFTDEMGHDGSGVKKMLMGFAGVMITNPGGFGFQAFS